MKKLLAILIILAILATLGACTTSNPDSGANIDPTTKSKSDEKSDEKAAAYGAVKKLNGLMNSNGSSEVQYDIDIEAKTISKVNGAEIPMDVTGNMKAKCIDGKTQFSMIMETEYQGTEIAIEMISDGEKVYYTINGEKQQISISEALAQFNAQNNAVLDFEEKAIKSVNSEKDGEYTKYTIEIDVKAVADLMSSMMGGNQSAKFDFKNLGYTVWVDGNEYPAKIQADYNLTVDDGAQIIEQAVSMTMKFNSFTVVNIDFSKLSA